MRWRDASLDQLIPKDHQVRAVWAYVESPTPTPPRIVNSCQKPRQKITIPASTNVKLTNSKRERGQTSFEITTSQDLCPRSLSGLPGQGLPHAES